MNLLDRYLTRAILAPTLAAFLVVSFIIVINEMKSQIARELLPFLTARDIAVLGGALLPSVLPMILPAAVFFGILMGYGRLAERGEITAMRASGISLVRVVFPAIAVGILATAGIVAAQDLLLPRTMNVAMNLLRNDLPRRATLETVEPGVMHAIGDWRVYFKDRDADTHTLLDVIVVAQDPRGAVVYHSEYATASIDETGPTLRLGRGYWVTPDGLLGVISDTITLHLPSVERARQKYTPLETSTIAGLIREERSLSARHTESDSLSIEKQLRRARSTLTERVSLPFAAVLFACLAAPLAVESSRYRRGGRQRLLATGLIPVFAYYFLHVSLQANSLRPLTTQLLFAWTPNLVLVAAALALFTRVARVH